MRDNQRNFGFTPDNVEKTLGHLVDGIKGLAIMLEDRDTDNRRIQQEITNLFLQMTAAHSYIYYGVEVLVKRMEAMEWEAINNRRK